MDISYNESMPQLKFRSDLKQFLRIYNLYTAAFVAAMFGLLLFTRVKENRIPSFEDLFTVALFGGGSVLFVSTVVALAVYLFPVTITTETIKCYSDTGWYHTFRWDEISDVEFISIIGIPYLEISSKNKDTSITVPIWLNGWSEFSVFVCKHAGEHHPLTPAIHDTTSY